MLRSKISRLYLIFYALFEIKFKCKMINYGDTVDQKLYNNLTKFDGLCVYYTHSIDTERDHYCQDFEW